MPRALTALGSAFKRMWARLFGRAPSPALAPRVAPLLVAPAPPPEATPAEPAPVPTRAEPEPPLALAAREPTTPEAEAVPLAPALTIPEPGAEPEPVPEPAPASVDFVTSRREPEAPPVAREPPPAEPRMSVAIPKDYVPAAESTHELYQLRLDSFEGPLDLLLFLIRRHALDIFDIPIAFICEQYLAYLRRMEALNLDVASEFLATAAELLHIKSKMLLPKPAEVDDEDEIDPRAELVRRLLEYQKYRTAAAWLGTSAWHGRDTFAHREEIADPAAGERPLVEVGAFALIEAFGAVLARRAPEFRHQVFLEQVRVSDRMRRFIDMLAETARLRFDDIVGATRDRLDIVVSFLALLEMTRLRLLTLYQSPEGTLYLERSFTSASEALRHLEGIEGHATSGESPW